MNIKKIEALLGFAAKSRNLLSGFDAVTRSVGKGKVYLILYGEDLSQHTREKLLGAATRSGVKAIPFQDSTALSQAIGKSNRSIIGITDRKFAKSILEYME